MAALRPRSLRAVARQRGSTLTGLIIGLIVGLGIAVAVALTITKGASPFTEKTAKAGRPADPAPGQALDPNKPMYTNREAAREANKEVTQKAAARSAKPAEAAAADPLGQAIASMEAKPRATPRAESHPLATAPAASPAPAAPAAPAHPASPAVAGDRTSDSGVLHRVRLGPYNQVESMNKARAKLLDSGIDVAIVRNQR
jgi:cell division protein FtsN